VNVKAGTLGGRGPFRAQSRSGLALEAARFSRRVWLQQTADAEMKQTLTFQADGTYTCNLNTKNAKADQVIAKGVTIATEHSSISKR